MMRRVWMALCLAVLLLVACARVPVSVPMPTLLSGEVSPSPAPTQTPPAPALTPTAAPAPTSAPTADAPTPTFSPVPTDEPMGSLQEPSTWSESMRAYYERSAAEWDAPTREYLSDAEFDRRLEQMRRSTLAEAGIDSGSLSGAQVMLAYQRWAFENQQVMIFSPSEIAAVRNGPFRVAYVDYEHVSPRLRGGISYSSYFQSDPGQEALIDFMRSTGLYYEVKIFGTQVQRPPNEGVVGLLTGVVRIPGMDPGSEVLLYITYREGGVTYSDLISAPLRPVEHQPGDEMLDATGAVFSIDRAFTLPAAIASLCKRGAQGCSAATRLSVPELFKILGSTVIIHPHYALPEDMGGLDSIADLNPLRIERGYAVGQSEKELDNLSLPWD